MNSSARKFTLTCSALLINLMPCLAVAQNISSVTGVTPRNLERLTLLRGPYLLSPAIPAPQSTDQISIVPKKKVEQPRFRFVPISEKFLQEGKLTLPSAERNIGPMTLPRVSDPAPVQDASMKPAPESLHFDAASQPVPLKLR
jgi:hypothetical protein